MRRYEGRDRRGTAHVGKLMDHQDLGAWVQSRYNRGWRELRVWADESTDPIAEIGPDPGLSVRRRAWWAEA